MRSWIHRYRRLALILSVVAASAMVLSSCGGRSSAASDRIEPSVLADVPLPGVATASGPPSVDGATTTRSFQVTGMTPEQAVDFYVNNGPAWGWTVDTAPHRTGSTDWQVVLSKKDQTLTVSTAPWLGRAGGGIDVTELAIMVQ